MIDRAHSFGSYFKRATSPIVVLSLLREKEMYGYELSSEMKRRSGGRYSITVLYPVLYRLEELGYITTTRSEIVDGRTRSYYQITAAGRHYLVQTLAEYCELREIFEQLTEPR